MIITVEIPEELARQFVPAGQDPAGAALEAIALEGYRGDRREGSLVTKSTLGGRANRRAVT